VIDLLLVVVSISILVFVGSFAAKFLQGETAPITETEGRPANVKVEVLNGCGLEGAAAEFTRFVKSNAKPEFIVDVVKEENFASFDQKKTLLIARKPELEQARQLARKLGLAEDRVTHREMEGNFLDVDYTVVVGSDFKQLITDSGN
jgi:hypothetical protein